MKARQAAPFSGERLPSDLDSCPHGTKAPEQPSFKCCLSYNSCQMSFPNQGAGSVSAFLKPLQFPSIKLRSDTQVTLRLAANGPDTAHRVAASSCQVISWSRRNTITTTAQASSSELLGEESIPPGLEQARKTQTLPLSAKAQCTSVLPSESPPPDTKIKGEARISGQS